MADVTFDIRRKVGVLADTGKGWKKELNVISWNNREPKLDIREWSSDHSKMKKGVTLSKNEASLLLLLLSQIDDAAVIDKGLDSDSLTFFAENEISVLD
ncbi:MAG: hypothetical protein E7384_07665 [Ruminococcaceae bacterium]|nr:hypothetical protein [Oscillospiraceae bacterium]